MMKSSDNLEYVGFGARLVASLIDAFLFVIIIFPLLIAFYGDSYWSNEKMVEGPMDFLLSYIFPAVITVLFWFWKQATPGKMAFSAKIVDAKTGREPTIGQYVIRYLAYYLSTIPMGLGFLWVAFDPKMQGWHDKLAGTVVVRPRNRDTSVKFE